MNDKDAMRPVIGIVPSMDTAAESLVIRNPYVEAITSCGGAPVILPVTNDKRVYETLFPLMDGFVLTGGQDVSPGRYHATDISDKLSETTPLREEVECLILAYAYRYDVPTLGICRGMQMMNVFFGGTLYQDLADQFPGAEQDEQGLSFKHWQDESYDEATHFVQIIRNSKLGEILDTDELATNSMHHQGIKELSDFMVPAAYGPDGLVEAVELDHRTFMLGVQWHPEYFAGRNMGCIFRALISESAKARRSGRLTLDPLVFMRDDLSGRWEVMRRHEQDALRLQRQTRGRSAVDHV